MLYSMSIPIFIRQLKSLRQFLQKGENWLKENGHPESKLIEARLAPDMHVSFRVLSSAFSIS